MTHIFLYFVPGAAGNFFSRCLNLASDDIYGWVYNTGMATKLPKPKLQLSLSEKFDLFTYTKTQSFRQNGWIEFEKELTFFHNVFKTFDVIPETAITLRAMHPNDLWLYPVEGRQYSSDHVMGIYIDPTDCWEWVMLNAFKKDSIFNPDWLKLGKRMLDTPEIPKVGLKNILTSGQATVSEIQRIMDLLGKPFYDINKEHVKKLWEEWWTTTLKEKDFQSFKQELGFLY